MTCRQGVALLRGINVGGRNRVAMADLRAAFTAAGYASVSTYIQSGNVAFATDAPALQLESAVEDMLAEALGMRLVVVVRSHPELARIVHDAPAGFRDSGDDYLRDVVFLKGQLGVDQALAAIDRREGVDEGWAGEGVLYFRRLKAGRTRSKLSSVTARPEYRSMTIRNWATTTALLRLLDAECPNLAAHGGT